MSSLVINTNLSALSAYNNLNSTDSQMTTAIQRLSSGLKVQSAADGPAAYVVSQALTAQSNGYGVAMSNAQNGVSLLQTASGALNQISSILQTMNQLALSSANGATTDNSALAANQSEFNALQNQIDQISKTTSFGTTQLLNGSFSNQVLQVGAFNNADNQVNVSIGSVSTTTLQIDTTLASVGTVSAAEAAITSVQNALDTVNKTAATLGAQQNQLQAITANLTVGKQNLDAASSRLVDVNMAKEMTKYSTDQVLMQSGVAMLAQAQQAPNLVLKLLG